MVKRLLLGVLLVALVACSGNTDDSEVPAGSPAGESPGASDADSPDVTLTVESNEATAVVEHFKAEGLPIGRFDAYSAETAPFKPISGTHLYEGLVIFNDTRVEPVLLEDEANVLKFDESGGIIETFASPEQLQTRVDQIEAIRALAAEQNADLQPEYQVRQGTILLRLGHVMEEWTGEYEAALASYQDN